jgi:GT2 family glycosyltransferase
MKASIIILSYNRYEYLKNNVESLLSSISKREEVEIIIVDNGSDDNSRDYIKDLFKENKIDKGILFTQNQGISKGYNTGFAMSNEDSEYVIKLDCDIVIHDKYWLEEMEDIFNLNPEIGLLMLFQQNHPIMPNCKITEINGKNLLSLDEIICGSGCFTIPRHIFSSLGFFNEDNDFTIFYDDIDYFLRLNKIKKKAYYILSHKCSFQNHFDETLYVSYNKNKEIHYEIMDDYLPKLVKQYELDVLPIFKNYGRLFSIKEKYNKNGLYVI